MQKEELLNSITEAARSKIATLREVEDAFALGLTTDTDLLAHKRISVSDAMYLVGGLVIVMGISVLVGQHWAELHPVVRILSTLGAASVAFVSGLLLSRKPEFTIWSAAFYLISAILMPLGVYVLFDSLQIGNLSLGTEVWISGIAFLFHGVVLAKLKKGIHLLFTLVYGIWFYYMALVYLFGQQQFNSDQFSYITIVLGVSLGFLGVAIARSQFHRIAGLLYGTSTALVLGSSLALQGYVPTASLFWEGIFPIIAFGFIFLSSSLKSRFMLVVASVMLMGYIMKLTSEYFAGDLGWPLALVIAGLLLMAVGYLAFVMNKRYLGRKVTLPAVPV